MKRTIILSLEHLKVIHDQAQTTYPQECCGLLLGTITNDQKKVSRVWITENRWRETSSIYGEQESNLTEERRYGIDPKEILEAMKVGRNQGLNLVGIYHSHPDCPAEPSEFDRIYSWPEYSYIIISVIEGKVNQTLSWSWDEGEQFQLETLFLV